MSYSAMVRSGNKKSQCRIGIVGGTFDPIHLGHIKLAEEALDKLKLDRIIFVPAYVPPHKLKRSITSSPDRYRMIELAIEGRSHFEVSDIEMKLKGPSYSIKTVKEFKKTYGDTAEIIFITGSDSIKELKAWKDIEDLKRLCRFVIATRPSYEVTPQPAHTEILKVDTPDISSTQIRRLIRERKPFKKYLPQKVYNYIIIRKLYL